MNKKVLLALVMSLFFLNACGDEKVYKEEETAFCEGFFSYSDYVCMDKDGNPISGIMYSKRGDKYTFKSGKLDGVAKFYDDGKLWYEIEFKNGENDGAQKEYYPNGRLKHKKFYKAGKLVE